eukprot:s320_g28.t10
MAVDDGALIPSNLLASATGFRVMAIAILCALLCGAPTLRFYLLFQSMCAVAEPRWFQQDVIVVVENPSDQRNVERLQLACHVFGAELRLVQDAKPQDPRCRKSLDLVKEGYDSNFRISNSTTNCMKELREKGVRSVATALDEHSVSIYDTCFDCGKIALWFGQEKHGLTDEAIAAAHERVFIPMAGMVQSLNVAASAAVILAEVYRIEGRCQWARVGCPEVQVARQRVFKFPVQKWPADKLDAKESTGGYAQDVVDKTSHLESARMEKFMAIARKRQRGLVVVLHDPDRLDAGAMLRACDAFGVAEVHFVFEATKAFDPLANRQVMKSEGSNLWVCSRVFHKAGDCFEHLTQRGFTHALLSPDPQQPSEMVFESRLGLEPQVALWLGRPPALFMMRLGLPGAGKALAASNFVALVLAELVRQRRTLEVLAQGGLSSSSFLNSGSATCWRFTPDEQLSYLNWCTAVHAKRHPSVSQGSEGFEGGVAMSPEYERLGRLRAELARQGW